MNKTILVSGNAGQGKTSLAVNLAVQLRAFGSDVAIVDADMITPKVAYHVGIPLANKVLQDVLANRRSLDDAVYRLRSGLKVVINRFSLEKVQHPSTIINQMKKLADIVIIDVPNDSVWFSLGLDTIMVSHADFPSAMDLCRLNIPFKMVLNRVYGGTGELSQENMRELISREILGIVPDERGFREALRAGYPLVEFDPNCAASLSLKSIAAKLMNANYSVTSAPLSAKLGLW